MLLSLCSLKFTSPKCRESQVSEVGAVDRSKFRTCQQGSFCRRRDFRSLRISLVSFSWAMFSEPPGLELLVSGLVFGVGLWASCYTQLNNSTTLVSFFPGMRFCSVVRAGTRPGLHGQNEKKLSGLLCRRQGLPWDGPTASTPSCSPFVFPKI